MARRSLVSLVGLALAACVDPVASEAVAPAPVVAREGEACGPETGCEPGLRCLNERCSRRCEALAELCGATPCGTVDDACSAERVDCAAEGACSHLGLGEACALDGSGCCVADCAGVACGEPSCDQLCVASCAAPVELFPELDLGEEPSDRPSRRSHPGFAADGAGRALLFGGYFSILDPATDLVRERFLEDTWLFTLADGRWTKQEGPCEGPAPSPRRGFVLQYWPPRGGWLMVGGEAVPSGPRPDDWEGDQPPNAAATNEAWLFVDGCWSPLELGEPKPEPFTFAAAAWDPAREEVVLFSGWSAGATWVLTGDGRWTRRESPQAPSARTKASMAWDGRGLLLFGGLHYVSPEVSEFQADTWRWDGTAWTQLRTAEAPSPRSAAQLATHSGHGVLLFGGAGSAGTARDTTWLFHAELERWVERPAIGVATRERHGAALLDAENLVVGFGAESGRAKHDLWLFPLR